MLSILGVGNCPAPLFCVCTLHEEEVKGSLGDGEEKNIKKKNKQTEGEGGEIGNEGQRAMRRK